MKTKLAILATIAALAMAPLTFARGGGGGGFGGGHGGGFGGGHGGGFGGGHFGGLVAVVDSAAEVMASTAAVMDFMAVEAAGSMAEVTVTTVDMAIGADTMGTGDTTVIGGTTVIGTTMDTTGMVTMDGPAAGGLGTMVGVGDIPGMGIRGGDTMATRITTAAITAG